MTALDFIWAEEAEIFDGMGFWQESQSAGLVPYVRRDPAVLAELPEVKAMVAAAFYHAGQTGDGLAALDAYVAAAVRKALERAKAKLGGHCALWGEPCHDVEVGEKLAMEKAIGIIDAMIEDAPE